MSPEIIELLWQSLYETLYMVAVSSALSGLGMFTPMPLISTPSSAGMRM